MSGYIGYRKVPTISNASGVWGINEQAKFKKNSIWPADLYWGSVVLLIPMTGENNSTNIVDMSLSKKVITRYGDAKISTAQSKWGNGSGYFDGTGDYLSTAVNADFSLGSGDFCFETFALFNSTANLPHLLTLTDNSQEKEVRLQLTDSKIAARIYHTSAYQVNIVGTTILSTGTWYHLAFSRYGNVHTIYLNGVAEASATVSHALPTGNWFALIGQVYSVVITNTYSMNGYLQDLRITKGIARYTDNFTPPASPLGS